MEANNIRARIVEIVLTPLLDDSGPNVFGLHPHLTSMLWTLPLHMGNFAKEG